MPILPGVLPIHRLGRARRASPPSAAPPIPAWMPEAFERATRDGRAGHSLATAFCTELCSDLIEGGASHLHFYTLNRPGLTRDVVHALGLAPAIPLEKVA